MPQQNEVEQQPKLFVRFKEPRKKLPNGKAPKPLQKLEIKNGPYERTFDASEQPFEVKDDTELQLLKDTGHFVEDKKAEESTDEKDAGNASGAAAETVTAADKKKKAKTANEAAENVS